jgi:hypothetical protein
MSAPKNNRPDHDGFGYYQDRADTNDTLAEGGNPDACVKRERNSPGLKRDLVGPFTYGEKAKD